MSAHAAVSTSLRRDKGGATFHVPGPECRAPSSGVVECPMPSLPRTSDSLLVRTDFTDQSLWARTQAAVAKENADGFRAYVHVVDEPELDRREWQELRRLALLHEDHAAVLFVVDDLAITGEHPILVVDLSDELRPPFRCIARELWSVDNNLNLANMDWDEFAGHLQGDGVHRGFG